jgi:hypothetical protein
MSAYGSEDASSGRTDVSEPSNESQNVTDFPETHCKEPLCAPRWLGGTIVYRAPERVICPGRAPHTDHPVLGAFGLASHRVDRVWSRAMDHLCRASDRVEIWGSWTPVFICR